MNNNYQKGVSLIITFFIMIIILAVVLSVSVILYSEIKVIKNIGSSIVSFYAADSGVEKVLFYDRQVVPTGAARGLCSMFDSMNNVNYCPITPASPLDTSIYCDMYPNKSSSLTPIGTDCDPATCTDCEVSFSTTFDNRKYFTTAKVSPDGEFSNFKIYSRGSFEAVERQIEVSNISEQAQKPILIADACANPKSTPQGTVSIDISATVSTTISGDTIALNGVTANIYYYDVDDSIVYAKKDLALTPNSGCTTLASCVWQKNWTSATAISQAYYVDLYAEDTAEPLNRAELKQIPSCGVAE